MKGSKALTAVAMLILVAAQAGSRAAPIARTLADADTKLFGSTKNDCTGMGPAAGGDLDGDGTGDLVVGAPAADQQSCPMRVGAAGRAYVLFGPVEPSTTPASIEQRADLILEGILPGENAGTTSAIGDLDGDGHDDLIVAGPNLAIGALPGIAYVIYGPIARAPRRTETLAKASDVILVGEFPADEVGRYGVVAGDIDGDDIDDLLVGADADNAGGFWAGAVYVLYGGRRLNGVRPLVLADAKLVGHGTIAAAGRHLSIGDMDGDGIGDLAVARQPDLISKGPGPVNYVLYGDRRRLKGTRSLQKVATSMIAGRESTVAVITFADLDGDGLDDLIRGALEINTTGRGRVDVVYGRTVRLGRTATWASADLSLTGTSEGDLTGWNVVGVGDVSGDGVDDLAVSAACEGPTIDCGRGAVWIVGGGISRRTGVRPLADVAAFRLGGEAAEDHPGDGLAGGDVNGDGAADLVVGATCESSHAVCAGALYVVSLSSESST